MVFCLILFQSQVGYSPSIFDPHGFGPSWSKCNDVIMYLYIYV